MFMAGFTAVIGCAYLTLPVVQLEPKPLAGVALPQVPVAQVPVVLTAPPVVLE